MVAGWGSLVPDLLLVVIGLAVMLVGLLVGYVMGRASAPGSGTAGTRTGH